MDPLSAHKIQAINKYKKQQLVITNLVLYTLTALTCSLFCSSPFWYPPLRAAVNVFLYISLPKIISLFFSSKVVFIVGNLIVIFLVGEFKIFAVPKYPSPDYNDHEYAFGSKILQSSNKIGGKLIKKSSSKEKVQVNNYEDGGHQEINLRKEVARLKACESQFVGVHNYEKVMVGLEPRGPSRVTPREEHILDSNGREEKMEDWKKKSDGDEELSTLPVKDLNKMADDFIARVNKQRRLEAEFCSSIE